MRISPVVTSSSPAMRRSRVDLPQPEGPTNTTNSPSLIARSTSWITCARPKLLHTPLSVTSAIAPPSALHRAGGEPGDDLSLEHQHQHHHRHRHDDRGGHDRSPRELVG